MPKRDCISAGRGQLAMCKADFKVKKESKERDENWFIEAKQEENEIRSLQQCVRCWNVLLSVVLFNCEYKTDDDF